ncbi:MAG: hypothetical protein GY940_13725 [bacterium]|nr:hypothetical protein [bacterium]
MRIFIALVLALSLWIVTGSNSRKQFAMTTFTSYMMVAGKQYSVTSMGLLLVPVFFTDIYYFQVIPLIVLGLPLFIFMVSLSILVGSEVRSPDCRGWQWITGWGGGVFGAILLLETKVSFRDSLFTWYFIAALLALSLVLLWRAYKAWIDYEMDYVGPEFYSPGF